MIPFCKPYLNKDNLPLINETIEAGWITTGKVTEEVEQMIANYTGAKYCVLVNSCTSALHLCIEYLKQFKYGKNFRAYVPALTFAGTVIPVIHAGGKVVFGDVDETMCLNPQSKYPFDVAMPVHLCGVEAKTNYLTDVIEDSAHFIKKDQCKDSDHFFCYSFYATKNLPMGEGGAICTNNQHAANWFAQARHHGISKDGWKRYAGGNWHYDIEFMGWKYNPSDILSALLKINFKKIDYIHAQRQRCVDLYNKLLGYNRTGLHLYPILVKDRDKFIKLMADNDIQCSVHFLPLHQMTAFRHIDYLANNLQNTEDLGQKLVSLPLYPDLTNEEIEKVCEITIKTNLLVH